MRGGFGVRRGGPVLWVPAVVVLALGVGCGRGPAQSPRRGAPEASPTARDAGATPATSGDGSPSSDGGGNANDESSDGGPVTGLRGRIVPVEGEPSGRVLVVVPGTTKVRASVAIADDGSFAIPDLPPATYRLIVPADGVHSTADLYVKVAPDAGLSEVTVPRSRGCPVKIAVRAADGHLQAGASLELTLPDLPQVDRPHVARVRTDADGRVTIVGSCVRGFFEGRLRVPQKGSFDVRHGYVGTGRDQFDVVLPDGPDAGVTYANDD